MQHSAQEAIYNAQWDSVTTENWILVSPLSQIDTQDTSDEDPGSCAFLTLRSGISFFPILDLNDIFSLKTDVNGAVGTYRKK